LFIMRDRLDKIERIAFFSVIDNEKDLPKLKNAIICQN
jgi:hypothetical protein